MDIYIAILIDNFFKNKIKFNFKYKKTFQPIK